MKIHFTKKEYATLLEMLEIAAWVLHAHRTDEPQSTKRYRDLEQKVFSFAREFACEHLVQHDKRQDRYYPSRELEEGTPVMAFIQEFENDSFWDELIDRLSQRDLSRELRQVKLEELSIDDRMKRSEPHQKRYSEEFQKHGLERLESTRGSTLDK